MRNVEAPWGDPLALRVGWPAAAPPGGWARPHLTRARRRIHLMAAIRRADLARRRGRIGAAEHSVSYTHLTLPTICSV
eukprot:2875156-Alexandrium_andersonii.AAC.1